jgi:hypothetical protein
MKNAKYLLAGFSFLALLQCKSTKTATTSASPETFTVKEKQLEVAQKRWSTVSTDELKQGQHIFVTKCTQCHKPFEITRFSEKKWLHEIDDMSQRAKLSADEKMKLTQHILSYREAYTVAKAN